MAIQVTQFTDLVLSRLKLCAEDMGVEKAFKTAPDYAVESGDVPFAYGLIGGTWSPVVKARHLIKVPRTYVHRFMIYPLAGGVSDIDDGAESNTRALAWIDLLQFYYAAHDMLQISPSDVHPSGYPNLVGLEGIFNVTDTGLVARTAPGGGRYAAIDVSINLIMTGILNAVPSPYVE